MAAIIEQEITDLGGTFTYDPSTYLDGTTLILYTNADTTLSADVDIVISNLPASGNRFIISSAVGVNAINLNGKRFTINGQSIPQWVISDQFIFVIQAGKSGASTQQMFIDLFLGGNQISLDGVVLTDATVTLDKLSDLASGKIIVGNSSNRPTAVTPTGDVTITNAGVTAIGSGVIVNADINASAAIAVSKLAALTASKALVTDGSGVITTASQLSPALGGTGQDLSASTGFVKVSAGTVSAGSISEIVTLQVSFESGYLGDFKIKMPYAGTVTDIYAYATHAIAGTDNGTITAKNNAGTTMTGGVVTFTASDARGTAYDVTPSANNTFVAGDILTFTTAKTTAGGTAQLSITVTRTS